MAEQGFGLRLKSGARRLTVHCRFCGATLPCPPMQADWWIWLAEPSVKEFYRFHREHAGVFANQTVGAEIDYDDEDKKDDLPPLMNLLAPESVLKLG